MSWLDKGEEEERDESGAKDNCLMQRGGSGGKKAFSLTCSHVEVEGGEKDEGRKAKERIREQRTEGRRRRNEKLLLTERTGLFVEVFTSGWMDCRKHSLCNILIHVWCTHTSNGCALLHFPH